MPTLLFKESSYTNEEDQNFEHPYDDMYKLYKFSDEENISAKSLFIFSHLSEYKRNKEKTLKLYEEYRFDIDSKNKFLKLRIDENRDTLLSDLLKFMGDFEIYKIPSEFNIHIVKGEFVTFDAYDITALFLGKDNNYYYYEYLASDL